MKCLFAFMMTLALLPSSLAREAYLSDLLTHGQKMIAHIQEAKDCSIQKLPQGFRLCTGLVLKESDRKFLSEMTLKQCKGFLKQMGFEVHELSAQKSNELVKIKGVPQKDVEEFFNSTKLALILHGERSILFKNYAKKGDCIHEVLHFYQRHRQSENPLSPLKRKQAERRLQFLLEEAVKEVEKAEKAGNIQKAKKMAAQLQPFIQLQREWQKLLQWLDEKEIYQLFFDFPQEFKLTARDQDVALANLVRLKDSLPWDLLERVIHAADQALNEKYQEVDIPKTIKNHLTEERYEKLYEKGTIDREEFEKKVIELRKFKAKKAAAEAFKKGQDYQGLIQTVLMRDFEKKIEPELMKSSSLKVTLFNDLFYTKIMGKDVVVDTGAHFSTIGPSILKSLKRNEYRLVDSRTLNTVKGGHQSVPVIQILKPVNVSGLKVRGLTVALADLGFEGIGGILGMNFFREFSKGKWKWDLEEKEIKPFSGDFKKPLKLYANGKGEFDALEFSCDSRIDDVLKVRIDSGSQIMGDYNLSKKEELFGCLGKDILKKMKGHRRDNLYLSREVIANLGLPYLRKKKVLIFDLREGLLELENSL